jgi:hypothetical protein
LSSALKLEWFWRGSAREVAVYRRPPPDVARVIDGGFELDVGGRVVRVRNGDSLRVKVGDLELAATMVPLERGVGRWRLRQWPWISIAVAAVLAIAVIANPPTPELPDDSRLSPEQVRHAAVLLGPPEQRGVYVETPPIIYDPTPPWELERLNVLVERMAKAAVIPEREAIENVFRAHAGELRGCPRANPHVQVNLGASGEVIGVIAENCIETAVLRWVFPRARTGAARGAGPWGIDRVVHAELVPRVGTIAADDAPVLRHVTVTRLGAAKGRAGLKGSRRTRRSPSER